MKKEKMFEATKKQQMEMCIFMAGYDAACFDGDEDFVEEWMQDPEFRLRHVSFTTNAVMDFFSTYKKNEENQERIFNYVYYMVEVRYGKISAEIMDEFYKKEGLAS